nr:DUF4142 domain-containing protein [Actinoplanes lichenis]
MLRRIALALGCAGLLLVPATAAQAAPSDQDAAYLRAAHQSNLAEIAGGKVAQQKGQSQDVKDLGARFVTDHTKLDAALRQTADQLGVDLPRRRTPSSRRWPRGTRGRPATTSTPCSCRPRWTRT